MEYALIIRTKDGKEQVRWFGDPDYAFEQAAKLRARQDNIESITLLKQTYVF